MKDLLLKLNRIQRVLLLSLITILLGAIIPTNLVIYGTAPNHQMYPLAFLFLISPLAWGCSVVNPKRKQLILVLVSLIFISLFLGQEAKAQNSVDVLGNPISQSLNPILENLKPYRLHVHKDPFPDGFYIIPNPRVVTSFNILTGDVEIQRIEGQYPVTILVTYWKRITLLTVTRNYNPIVYQVLDQLESSRIEGLLFENYLIADIENLSSYQILSIHKGQEWRIFLGPLFSEIHNLIVDDKVKDMGKITGWEDDYLSDGERFYGVIEAR